MPDNVLSTEVLPSAFLSPRDSVPQALVDYEMGGVGISDPSQGLMVKIWRLRWLEGNFVVDAPASSPVTIFSAPLVTDLCLTFDQNMKPFIAFSDNEGAKYRWYDSTISDFRVTSLPTGAITPKCSLDDKRRHQIPNSDIILAYINAAGALCFRQQRDRYEVERILQADVGGTLRRMGMNSGLRMQFEIGF